MEIILDGNFQGGNCPGGSYLGGNCPGGSYPWSEFSRWELSWVGIFLDGNFPGGNCRVGIIQVAVFLVSQIILSLDVQFLIYSPKKCN